MQSGAGANLWEADSNKFGGMGRISCGRRVTNFGATNKDEQHELQQVGRQEGVQDRPGEGEQKKRSTSSSTGRAAMLAARHFTSGAAETFRLRNSRTSSRQSDGRERRFRFHRESNSYRTSDCNR